MSLTAADFQRWFRDDDDDELLGDALAALAVDGEAVAAVRVLRERH